MMVADGNKKSDLFCPRHGVIPVVAGRVVAQLWLLLLCDAGQDAARRKPTSICSCRYKESCI